MHEKMCYSKLNTEQLKRANSVMWCGAVGGGGINKFLKLSTKTRRWEPIHLNLETGVFMIKTPGFCTKKR